MLKSKSSEAYWESYSSYQSFESLEELNQTVKRIKSLYDLTPAMESVLATIRMHAKTYFGVCWMYRHEIARKAKVSLSSVKRAIKALREAGILTIHEQMHTKRGGKTHNVYVINPIDEPSESPSNEPSVETSQEQPNPSAASDSASEDISYRTDDKTCNKTLKDLSNKIDISSIDDSDILKPVPEEFVRIMKPFYASYPEIILARWKTVCSAVKNTCIDFSNTSWKTVELCWKDTVRKLKRGKIKNCTDDGIGGYFYGVLCDWLTGDFLMNGWKA